MDVLFVSQWLFYAPFTHDEEIPIVTFVVLKLNF